MTLELGGWVIRNIEEFSKNVTSRQSIDVYQESSNDIHVEAWNYQGRHTLWLWLRACLIQE